MKNNLVYKRSIYYEADYVSGRQYFGITNIFKNDCPVCRTCPAAPMLTAMPSGIGLDITH